jgi:hypothetical protein
MIPFRNYFFLTERVEKTDIIDLYVMMAMGLPEDPAYLDIYNQKFLEASQHIKDEIQYILLREVRHALTWTNEFNDLLVMVDDMINNKINIKIDNADIKDIRDKYNLVIKKLDTNLNPIVGLDSDYIIDAANNLTISLDILDRYMDRARPKEITFKNASIKTKFMWNINVIYNMFNNLTWHTDYGGKAWAQITQEAAKVLAENNVTQLVSSVDRFIDYVHNTGSVANKFAGAKDGWFNFILDLKAQSQNIRELMPFTSYEIRSMMRDPAWRLGMFQQPGIGADKSDKVIENLLRKYFIEFVATLFDEMVWHNIKNIKNDPDMNTGDAADNPLIKMQNMLEEYGPERVVRSLNNLADTHKGINDTKKTLLKYIRRKRHGRGFRVKTTSPIQKQFLNLLAVS